MQQQQQQEEAAQGSGADLANTPGLEWEDLDRWSKTTVVGWASTTPTTTTTTTATPDGKGKLLVECAAVRTSKLGSPVNDGSSLSIPTAALIV